MAGEINLKSFYKIQSIKGSREFQCKRHSEQRPHSADSTLPSPQAPDGAEMIE
ncbi:hypothetical protein DPMN_025110 [Dreissena polymorpha]|uniref:Uncharacterized protein n=1 Tax=Dreissena polymorpha TaxID=45954 RepID=A0A9D4LQH6_DREPO|nr:hypothetical protein DPMN_025110 [Dreissena polymorpha]